MFWVSLHAVEIITSSSKIWLDGIIICDSGIKSMLITRTLIVVCRPCLAQINQAIAVLYARQLLISLLADWPTAGHVVTADLLSCASSERLPYVLYLLNRMHSQQPFSKVCFVFTANYNQFKKFTKWKTTWCNFGIISQLNKPKQ